MTRPQYSHWMSDFSQPNQWRQLLRATLRECTYLPDPVARTYMHNYVISRYRAVSARRLKAGPQMAHAAHEAKHTCSFIRRANEGFQRPLDKVLLQSYGRTGKRRHELLSDLLNDHLPKDTASLKEYLAQTVDFGDGWKPPVIIETLARAHLQNAVVTANRIRPLVKILAPPIPKTNIWGKEVALVRRRNIRRKWYNDTLHRLMPPIPEQEVKQLDGLISGTIQWKPVKRRTPGTSTLGSSKSELSSWHEHDASLFNFLAKGPEKGETFDEWANGRPHKITARFMRRHWRRLSSLIPRPYLSPVSKKWLFVWDSPKEVPSLSIDLDSSVNLEALLRLPKEKEKKRHKKLKASCIDRDDNT